MKCLARSKVSETELWTDGKSSDLGGSCREEEAGGSCLGSRWIRLGVEKPARAGNVPSLLLSTAASVAPSGCLGETNDPH